MAAHTSSEFDPTVARQFFVLRHGDFRGQAQDNRRKPGELQAATADVMLAARLIADRITDRAASHDAANVHLLHTDTYRTRRTAGIVQDVWRQNDQGLVVMGPVEIADPDDGGTDRLREQVAEYMVGQVAIGSAVVFVAHSYTPGDLRLGHPLFGTHLVDGVIAGERYADWIAVNLSPGDLRR